MYKRMLRAVVATAFSAALAFGALAVGGDIAWNAPAGTTTQAEAPGDIAWNVRAAGAGDIAWNSVHGDIAWTAPADIGA
ncbi:5'-nucleotidase [Streptomyces paludis]|uniref:5'-nucleotidase n=2 Tax=Streptomyces paludis TaxID=2282738 RepID=A0A345I181_9ACTN|nr:5'-nucleotidase [Streptomyces paludis]